MASADQLKALLKSHIDSDETHFFSVAMQIAAHEARLGHGKLAEEMRALIDSAKARQTAHGGVKRATPISQPRGELYNLLEASYPSVRLHDMVLDEPATTSLRRIILEQRNIGKIRGHGLHPRRKLLLIGPPGTGKTMTASMLAGELNIPLFLVRLDALITKFMGETAAKLRQVFEAISEVRGIYFFDEFDAIGSQRGQNNDVGEIRRVLNSFLQMIEQDNSASIIVAATNHPELLDYAVFRRFDDVIEYAMPEQDQVIALLKARLANFKVRAPRWSEVAETALGLSHADVSRAVEEAIKEIIIHDQQHLTVLDLKKTLAERKAMRNRMSIGR